MVCHRSCSGEERAEAIGVPSDQRVGIVARIERADADIGLERVLIGDEAAPVDDRHPLMVGGARRDLHATQGRLRTGLVGVEREHEVDREPLEELHLLLGQGGAHRCDGVGESELVGRDHVHVPLDHDRLVLARVPPPTRGRCRTAPRSCRRARFARRVQVLRLIVRAQRASAKPDQSPPLVPSGEDQAMAEAVVRSTVALDREAGGQQVGRCEATRGQMIDEHAPAIGGVPDLPALDGGIVETAAGDVAASVVARGTVELGAEEDRSRLVRAEQSLVLLALDPLSGGRGAQFDAGALGTEPQRLAEVKTLDASDELDSHRRQSHRRRSSARNREPDQRRTMACVPWWKGQRAFQLRPSWRSSGT